MEKQPYDILKYLREEKRTITRNAHTHRHTHSHTHTHTHLQKEKNNKQNKTPTERNTHYDNNENTI